MISEWQDVRMDFFLEEVLSRFWNHTGNTVGKVLEIQYFPAILNGEHDRRAFFGAGLKNDFPHADRPHDIEDRLLRDGGIEALRIYEENHALGFVMTGDDKFQIDYVSISYNIEANVDLFYRNFGVNYDPGFKPIIFLWYNVDKKGRPDFSKVEPGKDRRIRVRYLDIPDFMKAIKCYKENKHFPDYIVKDDAV